jgi:pimeloyl-ACP methyl ester carboxylesterase
VLPGVTRRGRLHPGLVAVGRGLAAAGLLVAVVEPPGLSIGELTPAGVEHARRAAEELAARAEVPGGRVALAGVSAGATVALVLAGAADLAVRVSAVAALAPCCDTREALRVVTTGRYRETPFDTGHFFRLVIARSAVAWLEEGPARRALREHVLALDDYGEEPLRAFRSWPTEALGPDARALVRLLANEEPARFPELYAELTDEQRRAVDVLSPLLGAGRIAAPVELVVAREDKYIPLADANVFARACPRARLTVIESLEHAVPSMSLAATRDLARLDAAAVRFLAAAYSA